ncbi:Zinc finger protein [Toxocara canis]|uniref:Zinc finger protein n=1 Tax=Toxocara canis TaxID=6265 RepID=A0A0B2UYT4_TOXCA|nr:Zinc finger protein [Toxocara canis]
MKRIFAADGGTPLAVMKCSLRGIGMVHYLALNRIIAATEQIRYVLCFSQIRSNRARSMSDVNAIANLLAETLSTVERNLAADTRSEDESFLAAGHTYSELTPVAVLPNESSALHDGFRSSAACAEESEEKDGTPTYADAERGRKQSLSDVSIRRGERKRWRQLIDGFAQYAEWEAKVREREQAGDMPELDEGSESGTLSQTTEDPEAEYFFRTDLYSFPYKEFIAKISNSQNDEKLKEADAKFEYIQKQFEERKKRFEAETKTKALLPEISNSQNDEKLKEADAKFEYIQKQFEERKKRFEAETKTKALLPEKCEMLVCFACGRAFDQEIAMRQHINEEHFNNEDFEYKCKHCYRRFKRKHHCKRHEATHDPNSKFHCDRCSASFSLNSSLIVHRSRVHKLDEDGQSIAKPLFDCSRCGELFGTFIELSRHKHYCLKTDHIKKQRLEKKLKDQASSVAGSSKSTESIEVIAFKPKIDKSCPVCKEHFASYQSVVRHMGRKHPNEDINNYQKKYVACSSPYYPFACINCDKRFATKASLTLHTKRHADDRPFECEKCGRRYPIPSELRKHLITHEKKADEKQSKKRGRCSRTANDDDGEHEAGGEKQDAGSQIAKKLKTEYDDLSNFDLL